MNQTLLLLFSFVLILSPPRISNDIERDAGFGLVQASFQSGSSKDLAKHFEPSILLNLNGQNGYFSKTQAEFILKDFFRKNPPRDFNILHSGGEDGAVLYYVGTYLAANSQHRVLIKGNPKENIFRIYSLDILQINTHSMGRIRD